jgi:hypothetical protein
MRLPTPSGPSWIRGKEWNKYPRKPNDGTAKPANVAIIAAPEILGCLSIGDALSRASAVKTRRRPRGQLINHFRTIPTKHWRMPGMKHRLPNGSDKRRQIVACHRIDIVE